VNRFKTSQRAYNIATYEDHEDTSWPRNPKTKPSNNCILVVFIITLTLVVIYEFAILGLLVIYHYIYSGSLLVGEHESECSSLVFKVLSLSWKHHPWETESMSGVCNVIIRLCILSLHHLYFKLRSMFILHHIFYTTVFSIWSYTNGSILPRVGFVNWYQSQGSRKSI